MPQTSREFPARFLMHQLVTGAAAIIAELDLFLKSMMHDSVVLNHAVMTEHILDVDDIESEEFGVAAIAAGVADMIHLVQELDIVRETFAEYMSERGANLGTMMIEQLAKLALAEDKPIEAMPIFTLSTALLARMRELMAEHNQDVEAVSARLNKIKFE